jgi:hypothetical protein
VKFICLEQNKIRIERRIHKEASLSSLSSIPTTTSKKADTNRSAGVHDKTL